MANWNEPQNSSNYVGTLAALNDKINNLAKMLFPGDTNLPNGTIRLNDAIGAFEKWNGGGWDPTTNSGLTNFTPTWTPGGSMSFGAYIYNVGKYRRQGNLYYYQAACAGTLGGAASDLMRVNVPFNVLPYDVPNVYAFNASDYRPCYGFVSAPGEVSIRRSDNSNFALGSFEAFVMSGWFQAV